MSLYVFSGSDVSNGASEHVGAFLLKAECAHAVVARPVWQDIRIWYLVDMGRFHNAEE